MRTNRDTRALWEVRTIPEHWINLGSLEYLSDVGDPGERSNCKSFFLKAANSLFLVFFLIRRLKALPSLSISTE